MHRVLEEAHPEFAKPELYPMPSLTSDFFAICYVPLHP